MYYIRLHNLINNYVINIIDYKKNYADFAKTYGMSVIYQNEEINLVNMYTKSSYHRNNSDFLILVHKI